VVPVSGRVCVCVFFAVVVLVVVVVMVAVIVVVANHPLSLPFMCAGPNMSPVALNFQYVYYITFTAAIWHRPWAHGSIESPSLPSTSEGGTC